MTTFEVYLIIVLPKVQIVAGISCALSAFIGLFCALISGNPCLPENESKSLMRISRRLFAAAVVLLFVALLTLRESELEALMVVPENGKSRECFEKIRTITNPEERKENQ